MTDIFNEEKYQTASQKAVDFMKRQMNVNNYSLFPTLKENYSDGHTDAVIANVNVPEGAAVNYPSYVYCDQFYDETYVGICNGKHQNLGTAAKHLGLEITTYTDALYRSNICPLHEDGTWHSEQYFKETDYYGIGGVVTKTETYWYRLDKIINDGMSNGLKGFTLKYYDWLDEDGSVIDVDHLPGTVVELFNQELLEPDAEGNVPQEEFIRAETYTLRPSLVDDTILDDAVPNYADYTASLFIFADVEYEARSTRILYDGKVSAENLPNSPEAMPDKPVPFIRDAFVQPGPVDGQVIVSWITNFADSCTIVLGGNSKAVESESIVEGYYTYHAEIAAPLGGSYSYSITGKDGVHLTKAFQTPDNTRFLIAGDPQIIDEADAETWYQVQNVLNPLPTLIISMGDQVDAIADPLIRKAQYTLFTSQHSVPIATARGNHDKNEHYFGHFGLSNAQDGDFHFTHKGVLFIAIDTNNLNYQFHIDYIKSALADGVYDWAVLIMHHSLYSSSKAGITENVNTLRNGLSDFIVKETDIALVLAGHEHYLCRTTYPGKLFFTVPTCTGSKYHVLDNPSAVWNQVTVDQKVPMYTVMDVSPNQLMLTTFDLDGNTIDSVSVGR